MFKIIAIVILVSANQPFALLVSKDTYDVCPNELAIQKKQEDWQKFIDAQQGEGTFAVQKTACATDEEIAGLKKALGAQ